MQSPSSNKGLLLELGDIPEDSSSEDGEVSPTLLVEPKKEAGPSSPRPSPFVNPMTRSFYTSGDRDIKIRHAKRLFSDRDHLDSFLGRVYEYYQSKGFWCLVLSKISQLLYDISPLILENDSSID